MKTKREMSNKSHEELIEQILKIQESNEQIHEENKLIREESIRIQEENMRLKDIIERLRKEIARIKKISTKPDVKPKVKRSCEKNICKDSKPRGKKKRKQLVPTELVHIITQKSELPYGAVFKDFQEFTVQELETKVKVICYKIARYRLPNGEIFVTTRPPEVKSGHFGPDLKRHIVYQHHQNNVSQGKILDELRDMGIDISSGQIDAILAKAAKQLKPEHEELFEVAKKISEILCVDDTGERHNGDNWYCTAIQNNFFAYYKSTKSKSRITFLKTMRGKHNDLVLNDIAFAYMRSCKVRDEIVNILQQAYDKVFSSEEEFDLFIEQILLPRYRGVKIIKNIKEAALLGSVIHHGVDPNLILLSDAAGQFALLRHALCWVHVGRCFKKYIPGTDGDVAELNKICTVFWEYYRELDEFSKNPSSQKSKALREKFDLVFGQGVECERLAAILCSIRKKKDELLRVLENPNTPLHNNGTESIIRPRVIKRKVSGPTRSKVGLEARDTFASLSRTCRKNNISFWNFLGCRIKNDNIIPLLSDLIRLKANLRSPTAN